jgi:opacity protein-like surface antigen
VLLSGYIHKSQVEEVAEGPAPKTEPARPESVREETVGERRGGLEINLFAGLGLPSVKGTAAYNDSWSGLLAHVTENAAISSKSASSMFFGAGLNYFFTPALGVGLNFGYLKSKLDTQSVFTYTYGSVTKTATWTGTNNSFSSIPISLDVIARFGGPSFQGYLQAGPTIFMNDAVIDSAIGYGYEYLYSAPPYLYDMYDAARVPMNAFDLKGGKGKTSWTAFGGNIGAGATFMFSPTLGINVDARYFLSGEREFDWELLPGKYPGLFTTSPATTLTIDQTAINTLLDGNHLTTIKINPSFFQITAGVKIKL